MCSDVQTAARGWFEGNHHPHPRTMGGPSSLPWTYLGGNEVSQYVKACRHLNITTV